MTMALPHVQLYRDILNIRYQPPLFAVSAGLLLRDDIHHAFDHLELSFYFQVSPPPSLN